MRDRDFRHCDNQACQKLTDTVEELREALRGLLVESSSGGSCYCVSPDPCGWCEGRKHYWRMLDGIEGGA